MYIRALNVSHDPNGSGLTCFCPSVDQEQAADREHERDVFQQEIHNLEQQLKNPPKSGTGSDRRDREVRHLIIHPEASC